MKALVPLCLTGALAGSAMAASIASFEDLTVPATGYWNGSDGSGAFVSGGLRFNNVSNPDWGTWAGFGYSNVKDSTTPGWSNQYAAAPGSGVDGSSNYGVGYVDAFGGVNPTVQLPIGSVPKGLYVSNTTYAYLSMRDGDAFAKKFGGATGNDADWFKLTATGKVLDQVTGTADFYLADFRFADNSKDYIVNDWRWFDLSSLGNAASIEFSLSSSDSGDWGMNTPSYFVVDNVQSVPEPTTMAMLSIGALALIRRSGRGRRR